MSLRKSWSHGRARVPLGVAGVLAGVVASVPAPSRADDRPATADVPSVPAPAGVASGAPLQSMWRVEVGYRGNFVTNPGFNPFSGDDYLGQFSVTASRTLFTTGPFSFAAGLSWDYGKSSSTARSDLTSLELHRLLVPLEARLHFGRWGYALLRVEPGAALENAQVNDATLLSPLEKSQWVFAGDLSAGYAFPIVPHTSSSRASPSIWLQADGGYGLVVAQRLNLTSETPSTAVASAEGVDLGTLAMRGGFVRFALALGF